MSPIEAEFAVQEAELKKLSEEIQRLCEKGNYAQSILVALQALLFAEKAFGREHPATEICLDNLAGCRVSHCTV